MTISGNSRRSRAFTLLEVMIALAIGVLVLGACMPAFLNWAAERKLRSPLNDLAKTVARARFASLASGNAAILQLNEHGFSFGSNHFKFDPEVRVRLQTPGGNSDWQGFKEEKWTVYASGLCEPWKIEFSLANGSFVRSRLDPLTGNLEEEESLIR